MNKHEKENIKKKLRRYKRTEMRRRTKIFKENKKRKRIIRQKMRKN